MTFDHVIYVNNIHSGPKYFFYLLTSKKHTIAIFGCLVGYSILSIGYFLHMWAPDDLVIFCVVEPEGMSEQPILSSTEAAFDGDLLL